MMHDVFIFHVIADSESVALPLAERLKPYGIRPRVELFSGSNVREIINHRHKNSKLIIILSQHFLNQALQQKEIDVLIPKDSNKDKLFILVLHNLSSNEVNQHSQLLANKFSVSTENGLDEIAQEIVQTVANAGTLPTTTVIGISGASCSGKSWFAENIRSLRPNEVTVFDLDNYYKENSHVSTLEHKYDNPGAINFDDAIADLTLLKSGKDVVVPVYDFKTHSVKGEKLCKHSPLIIVEGIFVFVNLRFRQQLDIKIWMSADENLRLDRRLCRDTLVRGRAATEVLGHYEKDVTPGFQKFIYPFKGEADLILENNYGNENKHQKVAELLITYALNR